MALDRARFSRHCSVFYFDLHFLEMSSGFDGCISESYKLSKADRRSNVVIVVAAPLCRAFFSLLNTAADVASIGLAKKECRGYILQLSKMPPVSTVFKANF